jgi:hypothetical protein
MDFSAGGNIILVQWSAIQCLTTGLLSLSMWLSLQGGCAPLGAADEPRADAAAKTDDARGRTAAAAEHVWELVAAMQVRDGDGQAVESLKPPATPLLTYNDPARGYLAGGTWRLGEHGRPEGLVSVEYQLRADGRRNDVPTLCYEFLALGSRPFELVSPSDGLSWRGDGDAVEFVALPNGPAPAEMDRQRLTQMKGLVRRLTVKQRHREDTNVLRLMPQPVLRYEDKEAGILDGAAFLFAYGTNPELLLLLECDAAGWRFAAARMSWAETVVELDGRAVQQFEQIIAQPTSGSYQTAARVVRMAAPAVKAPGQ